jgi:nitrite reductase/ring-hydroxylating ferredoxin subunit
MAPAPTQPLVPAPAALAFSAEVPAPGDYLTLPMTDPGVLLVRQPDGGIAAFLNRCRHRRRPVVIESHGDGAKGFICPFHAWRYGLDGDLTYAPRHDWPEADDGWPGLYRLPVEEADGLILAATEQDTPEGDIGAGAGAALAGIRQSVAGGLVRTARSDVRTEIDLPAVLSLALSSLAGSTPALSSESAEAAARGYTVNGSDRLWLVAPGAFVWRSGAGLVLLRARVLRRGGCEVQVIGFGGTDAAAGIAHALQESSLDAPPPLIPEIAAAFARPETPKKP